MRKLSLALLSILISGSVFAAPKPVAPKAQKPKDTKKEVKGISDDCKTCMGLFNTKTLKFSSNSTKCTQILSGCASKKTGECETAINDCSTYNCAGAGACTDELANRQLFAGCLKAESITLPYSCASYIAGKASAIAIQKQSELQQEERNHEIALQNQQLKSQEVQAKSATDVEKIRAQTEQQQMQAQLQMQQQEFELQQAEKDADIQRQKQEKLDTKNAKPNYRYNQTINGIKQNLAQIRTQTQSLISAMGVVKGNGTGGGGGMFMSSAPIVSVNGYIPSSDPKVRSYINASRYKDGGSFRCTRDVNESQILANLQGIYTNLQYVRNNLSTQISDIEILNEDEDSTGIIKEEKISSLYEIQNSITLAMTTIENDTMNMQTSCETRCNGMSSFSMASASTEPDIEYDAKGNIIQKESTASGDSGYSCDSFGPSGGFDAMSFLAPNSISPQNIFGGVNSQVSALTERVLLAVVETDRAVEYAEITANTGKVVDSDTSESASSATGKTPFDKCQNDSGTEYALISCLIQAIPSTEKDYKKLGKDNIMQHIRETASFLDSSKYIYATSEEICAKDININLRGTFQQDKILLSQCANGLNERVKGGKIPPKQQAGTEPARQQGSTAPVYNYYAGQSPEPSAQGNKPQTGGSFSTGSAPQTAQAPATAKPAPSRASAAITEIIQEASVPATPDQKNKHCANARYSHLAGTCLPIDCDCELPK